MFLFNVKSGASCGFYPSWRNDGGVVRSDRRNGLIWGGISRAIQKIIDKRGSRGLSCLLSIPLSLSFQKQLSVRCWILSNIILAVDIKIDERWALIGWDQAQICWVLLALILDEFCWGARLAANQKWWLVEQVTWRLLVPDFNVSRKMSRVLVAELVIFDEISVGLRPRILQLVVTRVCWNTSAWWKVWREWVFHYLATNSFHLILEDLDLESKSLVLHL